MGPVKGEARSDVQTARSVRLGRLRFLLLLLEELRQRLLVLSPRVFLAGLQAQSVTTIGAVRGAALT